VKHQFWTLGYPKLELELGLIFRTGWNPNQIPGSIFCMWNWNWNWNWNPTILSIYVKLELEFSS